MVTAALKRLGKNEKGFTLIELLAVIVILGIIAAIAVPLIGNVIDNTRRNADVESAKKIVEAARLYVTAERNGNFRNQSIAITSVTSGTPATTTGLQHQGYLPNPLNLPSSGRPITGGTVEFDSNGALAAWTIVTADGTYNVSASFQITRPAGL